MTDFSFGQKHGGVIQFAYKVDDMEQALAEYAAKLGVGPWFVIGPFTPPAAQYRGASCLFEITIALGFAGHIQVELLQQHNAVPSALQAAPVGFHHWGIGTRDYAGEVKKYQAKGYEMVFTDQGPDGARVAYFDTRHDLAGMIEVIEMTPGQEAMFTMMQQAAADWDGVDPVRRLSPKGDGN